MCTSSQVDEPEIAPNSSRSHACRLGYGLVCLELHSGEFIPAVYMSLVGEGLVLSEITIPAFLHLICCST